MTTRIVDFPRVPTRDVAFPVVPTVSVDFPSVPVRVLSLHEIPTPPVQKIIIAADVLASAALSLLIRPLAKVSGGSSATVSVTADAQASGGVKAVDAATIASVTALAQAKASFSRSAQVNATGTVSGTRGVASKADVVTGVTGTAAVRPLVPLPASLSVNVSTSAVTSAVGGNVPVNAAVPIAVDATTKTAVVTQGAASATATVAGVVNLVKIPRNVAVSAAVSATVASSVYQAGAVSAAVTTTGTSQIPRAGAISAEATVTATAQAVTISGGAMDKSGAFSVPQQSSNVAMTGWAARGQSSVVNNQLVTQISGSAYVRGSFTFANGGNGTVTIQILLDGAVVGTTTTTSANTTITIAPTAVTIGSSASVFSVRVGYSGYLGANVSITAGYVQFANTLAGLT